MLKSEWLRFITELKFYKSAHVSTLINQLLVTIGLYWVISFNIENKIAGLAGLFFWQYVTIPLTKISQDVWEETSSGAFAQTVLHTSLPSVLFLYRLALQFIWQTLINLAVFPIVLLVFQFSWEEMLSYPWLGLLLTLALTLLGFIGMGLMMAGIVLIYRRAISYASTLEYIFLFFAGIVVPFERLPAAIQAIAQFLPLTIGIQILNGLDSHSPIGSQLALLALQSVTLMIAGQYIFMRSLASSRKYGFSMRT